MKKRRRGRGEGAAFYSESKQVWVGRAVVGRKATGGPKYREVTARTKGELLAKLRGAGPAPAGGVTVGEQLTRWLEAVARPSVDPNSYESYALVVRLHLLPRVGGVRLADMTPARAEELFAGLHADGVRGNTARQVRVVFGAAMKAAVRKGLLPAVPTAGLPMPRAPERAVEVFTPAEVRAILAAARPRRHGVLAVLALATGARLSEILGLAWEHVDLDAATVRVERSLSVDARGQTRMKAPKTRRGRRVVSLPAFAVEALRAGRADAEAAGLLAAPVVRTRTGRPLRHASARAAWGRMLAAAGVPRRVLHTCRHTHASQLLSMGVNVMEVARRLGDHPATILRCYAHHMPADERVPERLQELYG